MNSIEQAVAENTLALQQLSEKAVTVDKLPRLTQQQVSALSNNDLLIVYIDELNKTFSLSVEELLASKYPAVKTKLVPISLNNVDASKSELSIIKEAINNKINDTGFITGSSGEQIVFYTTTLHNVNDANNLNTVKSFYRLTTGATVVQGINNEDTELMPDGSAVFIADNDNILDLGDLNGTEISEAFNSDSNGPYIIKGYTLIKSKFNGNNKIWLWTGGDGTFGHNAQQSSEYDFIDLTSQEQIPEPPGGSAIFENDIVVALPSGHTLGKYSNGDTIPAQGKTFEEVMNDIAQAVINPTFVAPAFGLSSSVSGTREIGTTLDVTLTANFNRGRINGTIVGGVWNPTAKQADRAGAATDYEFQGVSNGTNNVKTINDYLVTSGSNSFSSKVTYAEGAQPKNSVGDDYSAPLPAGNMTANTAFTGALYRFFGAGPETVDFRTLSRLFDTTNINNTFDLPTGVTHNNFHLLIPKARELEKVELVEASFADITSEYIYQGIINVPDANGDLHEYKYYLMTTAIPYSSNSTHRIKIKNA